MRNILSDDTRRALAMAFLCLAIATPAISQTVRMNPSEVHYKPALYDFAECGLKVGFDPRWPQERNALKDKKGNPKYEYVSHYTRDLAKQLLNHPVADVIIMPTARINVGCETKPSSADEAARRADRFAKIIRNGSEVLSAPRRDSVKLPSGTWETVDYRVRSGNSILTWRFLFQVRNGRMQTVNMYVAQRSAAGFIAIIPHKKTVTIRKKSDSGQIAEYAVILKNGLFQLPGFYTAGRSHGENRVLLNRIQKTIR